MSKSDSSENIIVAFIILFLLPIPIIVNGLLLKALWGWFIVPLGLPHIGVAHALGIALVASMLTHEGNTNNSAEGWVLARMILRPIIILLLGIIFHTIMV